MPDLASTTPLVSPDRVQQHIGDPGVRIVEVDFDRAAYEQGHIPGALAWDWGTQLSDGVRRDLASREALSELLSDSGVGPATHVVLYGEDNWYAAWAFWQLGLYGVDKVSLIDGGRRYWLEHALPLSTDVPDHPRTTIELPQPDFSTRAFLRDVEARLDESGFTPVDVRLPLEFNGEATSPPGYPDIAQRAGHIPGAVSVPWEGALNEDGRFKSADELRAHYAAKGVTGDQDIVTYCGVGVRSSHSWFVLHELLGFGSVRNYDGSWAEWGSVTGVPIENPSAG